MNAGFHVLGPISFLPWWQVTLAISSWTHLRNERDDKTVRVRIDGKLVSTGVNKFGAVLGDGCRVGANAVIAPGALLAPGTIIARTALRDDELDAARLASALDPVAMRNA
nr:hypothetical protein [Herbaspirillum sp. B39]